MPRRNDDQPALPVRQNETRIPDVHHSDVVTVRGMDVQQNDSGVTDLESG